MTGIGWLILVVMFLIIASEGEVFFILTVGSLIWWIVRKNKRSGRADNPLKLIENLFVDKKDHEDR